jgi:uncharacterized protein
MPRRRFIPTPWLNRNRLAIAVNCNAMIRTALAALALLALGYLALCAYLFVVQRSMIYYPQPRYLGAAAPTLTLPTPDGNVLATIWKYSGPNALIYFGGNAEDASLNLPDFERSFPDHALYFLHYRGYGGSAGKPTEAALIADGLALFDRVHAEHRNIAVIGRSLGAGVAIQVASQRPVARLVLVTPFHSLREFAASQFPYFPVRWLLLDHYDSWRYAPKITVPTTIIGAENDEIIPRASTELLHGSFKSGTATLHFLAGTGHNTIQNSPQYLPLLGGK